MRRTSATQLGFDALPEQSPLSEGQQYYTMKVNFDDDATTPSKSKSDHAVLHTILWCLCSAMYTVLGKRLLDSFPFPLTITSVILGTQALYSLLKWTCPTRAISWFITSNRRRRSPSFRRFKRRHWQKLLPAALTHGVGSILIFYSALLGPVATSVLMQLLPRPFWKTFPPYVLIGVCVSSVSLSVPRNGDSSHNYYSNYYIYIVQVVVGLVAHLAFVARSRIRINAQRFNGSQNVFEVTCALSVVVLIWPLALLIDGVGPISYLLLEVLEKNPWRFLQLVFLGILYCISNEMTFVVVTQRAVLRRAVSWVAAVLVWTPQRSLEVIGALIVFGATWYNAYYTSKKKGHTTDFDDLPPIRARTQSTDSHTSMGSSFSFNSSSRGMDRA